MHLNSLYILKHIYYPFNLNMSLKAMTEFEFLVYFKINLLPLQSLYNIENNNRISIPCIF